MCIKFQPNRSKDGRDDETFEGKKHKPKFKGRTLFIKGIVSMARRTSSLNEEPMLCLFT